jgi:predicted Abi (CAAX) family protease
MRQILHRIQISLLTFPSQRDWLYAVKLLIAFTLIYLPIGLGLGFLTIDIRHSWQTVVSVVTGAFLMPALLEELGFRALLIPHPTESVPLRKRQLYAVISWILFVLYHLHPFVPLFFRTPAFITGAASVGVVCTLSYLRSGSIWLPIILHWVIVVSWLLVFGGLRNF